MRKWLSLCLLFPLLAGCDLFDREDGRLDLAITDAPVDGASAIVVRFSGVELRHEDGEKEVFAFDPPRDIDLLALAGGDRELLLSAARLPSGRYERIRLRVDSSPTSTASHIDIGGLRYPLYVEAGDESGLDLNRDFDVSDDRVSAFTIDFDLRRSVHNPASGSDAYRLRPVLRLVEDDRAGRIGGAVDSGRLVEGCVPAVYVFDGRNVTPDDVDGSGTEPLTSARVLADGAGYRYEVAFLPEGGYTVAFTCDAGKDDPGRNDTLNFATPRNVTVEAGRRATANF